MYTSPDKGRVLQGSKPEVHIGSEMLVQLALMTARARAAALDLDPENQVLRFSINYKVKNGEGKMPPITADAVRYWLNQYLQSQPETEFWIEPVAIQKLPEHFVVRWHSEADQDSHGANGHSPEMSRYAAEFFAREQMWLGSQRGSRSTFSVQKFPAAKKSAA